MPPRDSIKSGGALLVAPAPTIDWTAIRHIAGESFDRAKLFYHPATASRVEAIGQFMILASGLREYALATADDLVQVWQEIRKNTNTLDMLLDVTSEIVLLSGVSVHDLAMAYGTAIHAAIPRDPKGQAFKLFEESAFDESFMESVGGANECINLLAANPWLLTLLILKHTGHLSLRRKSVQAQEAADAAEPDA